MEARSPLGEFLQAKRARVSPDDVGLPRYGERRRVPGLRREELAMLAGVSAGYYTRLEQGQSLNASAEVLDAIAGAMQLTAAEREHLHVLSATVPRRVHPATPPREHADTGLRTLLATMTEVPALVTGRRNDVLAWNRAGHALFAGHLAFTAPDDPGTRPNMSRMVFLDAHTRALYRNWPVKARAVVGNLRMTTGRNPGDTALAALVGELAIESADFARMWAEHLVDPCGRDTYTLSHPIVGDLTVTQQTLTVPQEHQQSLITVTAEPGSPSAAALAVLYLYLA
ncbi:helix-turn-helix domain-containing protein [Actinoplanes couchii]|uniref:Transcriptional regulator n=1 Tax=Actinoplanes couchii TaxID=403638 RepID=A0ABQ3XN75_9ACTN|nr:helix-turn-helix transcriptional regulator [Actinoplanes couchii]MDR6318156.1 transcriptional regulator with XRE-family HTH domain [Actinoplanes couchii]GID59928.1 transcriptional regulator [Actinoplanes couchii]